MIAGGRDAEHLLQYPESAASWSEALPIGNGRLGAMVFGGTDRDRVQVNTDTFWSGSPSTLTAEPPPDSGPELLADVRRLLAEGRLAEAELLTHRFESGHAQAYQAFVDIFLDQPGAGTLTMRELDLRTAVATHRFGTELVSGSQRAFASAPAGLLMIERILSAPSDLTISLESPQRTALRQSSLTPVGAELALVVRSPGRVDPPHARHPSRAVSPAHGVTAAAVLHIATDASVEVLEGSVVLRGASWVQLVLADATDAEGLPAAVELDGDSARLLALARERLSPHAERSFEELLSEHLADHGSLYSKVDLSLGSPQVLPVGSTRQRLINGADGDPSLATLAFNVGRYLTITGSRRGTMPLNLQGIWNDQARPTWSSNYTTNINVQMNYWPTLAVGLPECYEPLLDLLDRLSTTGTEVAKRLYGLPGWTCHHNVDAWGFAWHTGRGNDKAAWADWAMGGVWLARHIVTHWEYTADAAEFTRRWPALQGALAFAFAWLVEQPDGTLGTSPSTSPENSFVLTDGTVAGVSCSTTADIELLRDLFSATRAALEAIPGLPGSQEVITTIIQVLPRLPATRITQDGRVAEWSHDLPEFDPLHRHQTHLVGVFPGSSITPSATPDLAVAAMASLSAKGHETTGWSLAWRMLLWARLGRPTEVERLLTRYLKLCTLTDPMVRSEQGGVFASMLCAHPPLQLDGNFGVTAGIVEALLQSHERDDQGRRILRLLPASPWADGEVRGLCARDALEVDLAWVAGRVVSLTVRRKTPGNARIRVLAPGDIDVSSCLGPGEDFVRHW